MDGTARTDDPRAHGAPRARWSAEIVACCAAVAVRAVASVAQWRGNPALRTPSLDAAYYLDWARDIAAGRVLSAGPVGAVEPYLLNPLYAWLIAPLAWLGDGLHPGVLALQALLGGATAWLAAGAARRHAGAAAAWIAGLAVALSASLVHLSTHVSVATVAALFVAGAAFACAPGRDRERGHGGAAAGLWLGLGALARPVTLLALPFAAWLQARRGGRTAALAVLAAFGVCAGASLARNALVSGETVVFTAANGLNLHLGQNPLGRATRSMLTDDFHFDPVAMHVDARHRVGLALGREPTRPEVSGWYRERVLAEVTEHPGDALLHAAQKARWFLSPAEPPSSADLTVDLERVPWLRIGMLPTWLLVVAGLVGAWSARQDGALLLGAGGLVLAHWAACTLSFPLSHYRAPAVPALAVLAGCGVATLLRDPPARAATGALAAGLVLAAWLPPQPGYVPAVKDLNAAVDAVRAGDGATALARADRAAAAQPRWSAPLRVRADALLALGRLDDAMAALDAKIARTPWDVATRRTRAELFVDLALPAQARTAAEALVRDFPWSPQARAARGAILAWTGDLEAARRDLAWARERGVKTSPRVLKLTGPLPDRSR